jgi:hypothetical protein
VFASRHDEVNARTDVDPAGGPAEVHVLDVPLLSTLLFANTRTGRPIDPNVRGFEVLASEPPPPGITSFDALPAERVITDAFGRVYVDYRSLGQAPMLGDGSVRFRVEGGRPLVLRVLGPDAKAIAFAPGAAFTGDQTQREEIQFYPGEHANQGFRRQLFNGPCAGCHGSVSGQELDVAVDIDILTRASQTLARDAPVLELVP